MLEPKPKAKKEISTATWLALLGFLVTIGVALIGLAGSIVAPIVVEYFNRTAVPPTPIFACIQADEILVKFHVSRSAGPTIILSPRDTVSLEPGVTVYFDVEIIPIDPDKPLPPLECSWTNTGIATDGSLLRKTGCTVDYQSGFKDITDSVTMQLSQPSCPALFPIPFFIMPKQ